MPHRTTFLWCELGDFTLYGDDGQPFTAQWLCDANLHTPNVTNLGITGWARINGDVKRLHVCEHEPCRARWRPCAYGMMPAPIHGQISPPASSSACANTQAVDTPPPAAEEPPPSAEEPPPAGNAPPPGAEESPSVVADSDKEPSHWAPSPQTPEIETPVPSPFSSPSPEPSLPESFAPLLPSPGSNEGLSAVAANSMEETSAPSTAIPAPDLTVAPSSPSAQLPPAPSSPIPPPGRESLIVGDFSEPLPQVLETPKR